MFNRRPSQITEFDQNELANQVEDNSFGHEEPEDRDMTLSSGDEDLSSSSSYISDDSEFSDQKQGYKSESSEL